MGIGSKKAVAALVKLSKAFENVAPLIDSDARDADDEVREVWGDILVQIDAVSCQLKLRPADRSYRTHFSANYQSLFPNGQRHYRLDLLLASVERQEYIWLNGTRFDIGAQTMLIAQSLHAQMQSLQELVTRARVNSELIHAAKQLPRMLVAFDSAWAAFEHRYIKELEVIETAGRNLLVQAAAAESALRTLESCSRSHGHFPPMQLQMDAACSKEDPFMMLTEPQDFEPAAATLMLPVHCIGTPTARDASLRAAARSLGSEMSATASTLQSLRSHGSDVKQLAASATSTAPAVRRQALKSLTEKVAQLNACANLTGKGREDLGMEVLEAAANALLRTESVHEDETPAQQQNRFTAAAARRTMASKVLKSFASLRSHLSELAASLDHVDPQLSNNASLATRLRDWEEAWEMGSRYLVDAKLMTAVCGIAAVVVAATRFAPRLREACEDQDSELFLILPRLVWLCALAEPGRYAALPASLLPHHFAASGTLQLPASQCQCSGPEDLQTKFQRVCSAVSSPLSSCTGPLWELLVKRAVSGTSSNCSQAATEELMRHLEGRSMELQRHVPEDWNRCCSVLLECVAAAAQAENRF